MKHSKYHHELGATAACTKRIMEATKGIGQKSIKWGTKDCFLLIVGSPQRRRNNLQWKLVPRCLVW